MPKGSTILKRNRGSTILKGFSLYIFHCLGNPQAKRNRNNTQTCERATGILFDAKRPPARLFPDCWTPLEGTLFIAVFLEPSVPGMLGTLKLPWMLWRPWILPERKKFSRKFCLKNQKAVTIQKTTHQSDDKGGRLHQIEERKMKEMSVRCCREDLMPPHSEMTTTKSNKFECGPLNIRAISNTHLMHQCVI